MGVKCGNCGSTNLGSEDWDIWHYMRDCRDCGARTRYNRKGKIIWVKGDKKPSSSEESNTHLLRYLEKRDLMPSKLVGHIEGLGGIKSIVDNLGRNIGDIDSYRNIKDTFGNITGHIDSFGNIKDNFGNIKGYIDNFGNFKKS